jgi:glyoxylase-like metal-dependent hydrolase (beta-lactamase superfamily II)
MYRVLPSGQPAILYHMKYKLPVITFLISLCVFSYSGCNHQGITKSESQKIDSLIEIQKINEQCILIKFGADAITAINTKDGIVLVDAGISSGLTARYRKIIEHEFQRKDFALLINTHGHPDHTGGNSSFPESGIIGHVNCLNEMNEQWNNREKSLKNLSKIVEDYELQLKTSEPDTREWNEILTQKIRYQYAYLDAKSMIPCKLPDITFSDTMNIDMKDITIEMIYFGNSHSHSDILIYVPEMAILLIGDLFSKYGRLSFDNKLIADNERWQLAIHWIEKRMANIKIIIGGHGDILSLDDLKSFNTKILAKSPPE